MAFVLQTSGPQEYGLPGGGLGYAGLYNSLAFEFDTFYNSEYNDPEPKFSGDRHISGILKKGKADANEVNAFMWNNDPANINNKNEEGYIENPKFTIEFLNSNFVIKINDVIQAGYYYTVDLNKEIGMENPLFYFGITASNGQNAVDLDLKSFKMKVVKPKIKLSKVFMHTKDKIRAGDFFTLSIDLKTGCGSKYIENPKFDDTKFVGIAKNDICVLHKVFPGSIKNTDHTYLAIILCKKSGNQNITLLYKNETIGDAPFVAEILPSLFEYARVEFHEGQYGTIDGPFRFKVIPEDSQGNVAETNSRYLQEMITVKWPNPAETRKIILINRQSDGSYVFLNAVDRKGIYRIESSLFVKTGGFYEFQINRGVPNNQTSSIEIVDLKTDKLKVPAGTEISVKVDLKDWVGYEIDDDKIISQTKINAGAGEELAFSQQETTKIFKGKLTKAGPAMIKATFKDFNIFCKDCSLKIIPGAPFYPKFSMKQFNVKSGKFEETSEFKLNKGDLFQFLLVQKDEYENIIEKDNEEVIATLSGNYMVPINLCTEFQEEKVKISVCEKDKAQYFKLVGRKNYQITVKSKVDSLKIAIFAFEIDSHGTDADIGNGPYMYQRCFIYWIVPPRYRRAIAGEKYTLSIRINNVEGLRYNGWIDTKLIKLSMMPNDPSDFISGIRKADREGQYFVDLIYKSTSKPVRRIFLFVENKRASSYQMVKIIPNDAAVATLSGELITTLQRKTFVNKEFTFEVATKDSNGNPSDMKKIDFGASKDGKNEIKATLECSKLSLGNYKCKGLAKEPGDYQIQSYIITSKEVFSVKRSNPKAQACSVATKSQKVTAGESIEVNISVQDEDGTLYPVETIKSYLKNFAVKLQLKSTSEVQALELVDEDKIVAGKITKLISTKKATVHKIEVFLNSEIIKCTTCAVLVVPGPVDFTKTKFTLTKGGNQHSLDISAALTIANKEENPLINAFLFDKFMNDITLEEEIVKGIQFNTELKGTKIKAKYTLKSSNIQTNYIFSVNPSDYKEFSEELYNDKCSIDFTFKQGAESKASIASVTLLGGGKEKDNGFTTDTPDVSKVIITPKELEIEAGKSGTFLIELRAANNKLYTHPKSQEPGWYDSPQDSLKFSFGEVTVVKGKVKGTYVATITWNKAVEEKVKVSFKDPETSELKKADSHLHLIVKPGPIAKTQIMDDSMKVCIAGTIKEIPFKAYDKFDNEVSAFKMDNLKIKAYYPYYDIVFDYKLEDTKKALTFECKHFGIIRVDSGNLLLASNKTEIKKYDFEIVAGEFSFEESSSFIDKYEGVAPDTFVWTVYLRDKHRNTIKFTDDIISNLKNEYLYYTMTDEGVKEDKKTEFKKVSYKTSIELTTVSKYTFFSYFKGQKLKHYINKVDLAGAEAIATKSDVRLFVEKTGEFEIYKDKFIVDKSSNPKFKVFLKDKFGNPTAKMPSSWKLKSYLTNEELEVSGVLNMCMDGLEIKICQDKDSLKKWNSLITTKDYTLRTGVDDFKSIIAENKVQLTGEKSDPKASNLPVDPLNCLLLPAGPISSKVGKLIQLTVDIRTTNKNLRPNSWFENPAESIKLSFSRKVELKEYTIKRGTSRGLYDITFYTEKAIYKSSLVKLMLTVNSTSVKSQDKDITVVPEAPEQFREEIPTSTISADEKYWNLFTLYDKYGNRVFPTEVDDNWIKCTDESGNIWNTEPVINPKQYLDLTINLPKVSNYTLSMVKSVFKFKVVPGKVDLKKSYAKIQEKSEYVAGTKVQIEFHAFDQHGNEVPLKDDKIVLLSQTYNSQISEFTISKEKKNLALFTMAVTKKGENVFSLEYEKKPATFMGGNKITVVPGPIAFLKSVLYEIEAGNTSPSKASNPLREKNKEELPNILLKTYDAYSNELNKVEKNLTDKMNFVLFGNDLTQDKGVVFKATGSSNSNQISLSISSSEDLKLYKKLLFRKTPYKLLMTYKPSSELETLEHSIILQGSGDEDIDAEIIKPADISKTYFSKDSLSIVAGNYDSLYIEIRTSSGLRKADSGSVDIKVEAKDKEVPISFKTNVGDLKGRFFIHIQSTKAGTHNLVFKINGTQTSNNFTLSVSPDKVATGELLYNESFVGNADTNYNLKAQGKDKYGNRARVSQGELQVAITASHIDYKDGKMKEDSVEFDNGKEDSGFKANYVVKSIYAGDYTVTGALFSKSYKFKVNPGVYSKITSSMTLQNAKISAGQPVEASLSLFDQHFNILSITDIEEKKVQVSLDEVSMNRKRGKWDYSAVVTKAGKLLAKGGVDGVEIPCKDCQIEVSHGPVDLEKTLFRKNSEFLLTRIIEIPSGNKGLNLFSKLFDKYQNLVNTPFSKDSTLSIKISGKAMKEIEMEYAFDHSVPLLSLSIKEKDQAAFSYLVAGDYQIVISYTENGESQSLKLKLSLSGVDEGYGNGELDLMKTFVKIPLINLIAGESSTIQFELRTKEDKIYNKPANISAIKPFQDANSKSTDEKLQLSIEEGAKNGLFLVRALGKTSIGKDQENKTIYVTYEGTKIPQRVAVQIFPNVPDIKKTNLISKMPDTINKNGIYKVIFNLYDAYGNQYTDSRYAQNLQAIASMGSAEFSSFSLNAQNQYEMTMRNPIYPPKSLTFNVFLKKGKETLPIFAKSFSFDIEAILDKERTEVIGNCFGGVTSNDNFAITVLLKNVYGYCYDKEVKVSLKISGNGVSEEIAASKVQSKVPTTSLSKCDFYYEVKVGSKVLNKVGEYNVTAIVNGEQVKKEFDTIKIIPAEVDITNSVLSLYKNTEIFEAGTDFLIKIALHDPNNNPLQKPISGLSVRIDGLNSSLYSAKINSLEKGFMLLTFNIMRAGSFDKVYLVRGNIEVQFSQLKKIDFSSPLIIEPSQCSIDYPEINGVPAKVLIGSPNSFQIRCRDKFNNIASEGYNLFKVEISGKNLSRVGVDNPIATVSPGVENKGNEYSVSFKVAWEGSYTVDIFFTGQKYGKTYSFKADKGICPPENPILCGKTKKCVKNYRTCEYKNFEFCESDTTPVSCLVQGKKKCVRSSFLCDCPTGKLRCKNSAKCVEKIEECAITSERQNCPNNLKLCSDKISCRENLADCPSPMVCPPGFNLCPDLSCVEETKSCLPYKKCPDNLPFRCSDSRCVDNYENCQTLKTCRNPEHIVCPDSTCAVNELSCRQPRICYKNEIKCWDQSCVSDATLCPKGISCPLGQALCEDKICRETCQALVFSKSRMRRMLEGALTKKSQECKADETKCPSGECAPEYFICPSTSSGPIGTVVCPDGSFSSSIKECVQNVCPPKYFHCPEGKCVKDKMNCGTSISCPDEYPHLCSDGSCEKTVTDCPLEDPCPYNQPLRCGSGVCRSNAKECPTTITCPPEMPVKCSDGSCKKAKYHCKAIVEASWCSIDKIRCPGGGCAYSKELCSTVASCGRNEVRCWDGSCKSDLRFCDKPLLDSRICPSNLPLRCPSGACATSIDNCPTNLICPASQPILCDDGNCRQSLDECSSNSQCQLGFKRCPDGSCSLKVCGTPVTCPYQATYKCQDNTCKSDPRDCPMPKTCPYDSPILCPDGSCASQRVYCKGFSKCPSEKPVRCPDYNCYASVQECVPIDGCPVGMSKCDDGSCSIHPSNCPKQKCPANLPYLCQDGTCTASRYFCTKENACPYNQPFKCLDGRCVEKETLCPKDIKCPLGLTLCPDGSCMKTKDFCPLSNGCPKYLPFKCANGECVNPKETTCPISNCPKETPIKCDSGLCVQSFSACTKPSEEENHCKNSVSKVPCADGTCVFISSMCKPTYQCEANKFRCGDGSCRQSESMCPLVKTTCPSNLPYRCKVGICVKEENHCPTQNGCPIKFPVKCFKTGGCVKDESACKLLYTKKHLPNGCTYENPIKCEDGSCAERRQDCKPKKKCPKQTCEDNSCAETLEECLKKKLGCKDGQYECPDKACVAFKELCKTDEGCPRETPFKCYQGDCVDDFTKCAPRLSCPNEAPFLCTTGACVSDYFMCSAEDACPAEKPYRCPGSICVDEKGTCPHLENCPVSNPVKCMDGQCKANTFECVKNQIAFCPPEKNFYCKFGLCTKTLAECHSSLSVGNSSRVLASTCAYTCPDGSCGKTKDDCQPIQGCFNPSAPIRCQDGSCRNSCEGISRQCQKGLTLCEDGTCRTDCPNFLGCPISRSYQCPNGFCGHSLAECAGDSSCPIKTPFRCPDNSCVSKTTECQISSKFLFTHSFSVSSSNVQIMEFPFLEIPDSSIKYGELLIPPGIIKDKSKAKSRMLSDQSNNAVFNIRGVPMSKFLDYKISIHPSLSDDTIDIFPLYHQKTKLNYHEGLRSSILEIKTNMDTKEKFNMPIAVSLKIDYIIGTNNSDYCLSTPNEKTKSWDCYSRSTDGIENGGFVDFLVYNEGIYAAVYNPPPLPVSDNIVKCDYYCRNLVTIILALVGGLILTIIMTYILAKGIAFFNKYKTKKQEAMAKDKYLTEMEKFDNSSQGMTVRDRNLGVNFESNKRAQEEADRDRKLIDELNFQKESLDEQLKYIEKQKNETEEKNNLMQSEIDALKKQLDSYKMAIGEVGHEEVQREVEEFE